MFKKVLNRKAYRDASEKLKENEMLCGTMSGDKPVYFAMAKDATDHEIREKAFEIREGRKMSKVERSLLSIAERAKYAS